MSLRTNGDDTRDDEREFIDDGSDSGVAVIDELNGGSGNTL